MRIETPHGKYVKDQSGLWHYTCFPGTPRAVAAADAIRHRPGPAWFWFDDFFVPIINDDVGSLEFHSEQWRQQYKDNPDCVLSLLRGLATTQSKAHATVA